MKLKFFFKLYILLYAEDTVILAQSREELQAALNAMYLYCNSWDLKINPSKTKITIFCNRKFQHNYVFTYNGQALEIDKNFVFLGTMFSYNGRFLKKNQRMVEQVHKTMFSALRKSQKLQPPIDLQLQFFDSMIVPILLYGSEVTGFENSDILERLCTQFYKIILNVKKSTPNCILYGELGRYPISIQIKSRMIGFWQRIVNRKQEKIAHRLYKILLAMHEGDHFHSRWLLSVKN